MKSQELAHSPTSSQLPTKLDYPQTNVIHWHRPELPRRPSRGFAVNTREPRDTHLPIPPLQPSFTRMLTCEKKKRRESHGQVKIRSVTLLESIQSSIVNSPRPWDSDLILTLKQMKRTSEGRTLRESRVHLRLSRCTLRHPI
jgi:hypothetical protein